MGFPCDCRHVPRVHQGPDSLPAGGKLSAWRGQPLPLMSWSGLSSKEIPAGTPYRKESRTHSARVNNALVRLVVTGVSRWNSASRRVTHSLDQSQQCPCQVRLERRFPLELRVEVRWALTRQIAAVSLSSPSGKETPAGSPRRDEMGTHSTDCSSALVRSVLKGESRWNSASGWGG